MTTKKNKGGIGANVRFQPSDHRQSRKSQAEFDSSSNRRPLIPAVLTASLIAIICSLCYRGYLDTHYAVNSPFRGPKVTKKDSDPVLWGTFRPGQYLGLRTKEPKDLGSVNAGLMWYNSDELLSKGPNVIRYDCENRGDIKYGYIEHDTCNYGLQVIEELNEISGEVKFRINTTFLRPDHNNKKDWTVRVNYEKKKFNNDAISFIWYTIIDPGDENAKSLSTDDYELQLKKLLSGHVLAKINGRTPSLGDFKMSVIFDNENINDLKSSIHLSVGRTQCNSMADLKKCLIQGLMAVENQKYNQVHQVVLTEKNESNDMKNLVAIQITLYSQTGSFDIVYQQNHNLNPFLTGKKFTEIASLYSMKFYEKFNRVFKLENYPQEYILFARSTFSQMAGSIGYFYGNSLVKDEELSKSNDDSAILRYWKSPLLTSVPSRSQFPRGFLWDDGFHGLLLSKWSTDLELDIVSHWLDTMNCRGWIPREQILGSEARARVPSEFIVQSSTAANPPALLLTIESILDKLEDRGRFREENYLKHREVLNRMWPRLRAWYSYFNDTQGAHKYSNNEFLGYKWYGRDTNSPYELNPKTLTSGMDDYPRSSNPENSKFSNDKKLKFLEFERHLDLFCWMSRATRIMYRLGTYLNLENKEDLEAIENYREFYQILVSNLDRLHWADSSSIYADYGLHTDKVELRRTQTKHGTFEFKRFVLEEPKWMYVDKHPGYNSLFPLLMRIVPSKKKLNAILDLIESDLLTESCGLRSLSKRSNMYNKYNTEHDPPYWRGQVWININFLTLGSLNYYMGENSNIFDLDDSIDIDKETRLRCRELYNKLKNDVVNCIFQEWKRTGYVWERYSDNLEEVWEVNKENNGKQKRKLVHKGIGTRPFTGWSATVVLMMAELY
ncbi:uncharacterized protein LOC126906286 isoform X2 [Daktulosphaira vitifoliae]|uniref:uncharacterized protein LOC126906286 isoform X2 n=1 Tax=Daktulosphaira vitifoliae TaxID=58002 RepID=UPI0021AA757C|nr:uncharacterized protein LOC126906286 isoform X2 [Daktulosphaira vitifoliae]